MPDPLELTQVVLMRLSELLRALPPEQIEELYAGTATLEVVPKAGRVVRPPAKKPAAPGVSVQQVEADLAKVDDRAKATQYVLALNLTVTQLRTLARDMRIAVASGAKKDAVVHEIVQWTVGRRLNSEAISRPAASRF